MERPCEFGKCHRLSLRALTEAFRCSLCHQIFCLSHRNPEDHECYILLNKESERKRIHEDHTLFLQRSLSSIKSNNKLSNQSIEQNGLNYIPLDKKLEIKQNAVIPSELPKNLDLKTQNTHATVERIKLRMRSIGNPDIPNYNRVHLRIKLNEKLQRNDISNYHSNVTAAHELPSQKTASSFLDKAKKNSPNELYVWFDKTRSIGWHVDFLKNHFKITRTKPDEFKPFTLYLAKEHSDTVLNRLEYERLPYPCLVETVIHDGDILVLTPCEQDA